MTEISDLDDAIAHVRECTGDPDAWRAGLAPTDLAVLLPAAVIDTRELARLLQKVRANHAQLFDPRTGAPVTPPSAPPPPVSLPPPVSKSSPPPAPEGQQGEAAEAIKKAEDVLAQQNSSTAQLDMHVISAILNAHTTTVEGGATLRQLQRDIENSVRSRTDLDAPAGARDFQRFLIGKLREIGAVVETASLDDTSKAALASAWTALYESTKGEVTTKGEATEGQATKGKAGESPAWSHTGSGANPAAELPPYGADVGTDPLLDQLLADDPRWPPDGSSASGQPQPQSSPSTAPAAASMLPTLPTVPGLSGLGGLPGGLGAAREDTGPGGGFSAERPIDDPSLDELLGQIEEPGRATTETPDADPAELEDSAIDDATDSDQVGTVPPDGPTPVRLPNGDTVAAPNPQIANVLKAAIAGTPIGDAFREQGIVIPPAGTAVAHPVDPARVGSGDIGMFTDRQALALDRSRALLNGQIQPVAGVSGPSFLGWQHPPAQSSTTPSASTPNIHTPPPTRPATAAGHPR